MNGIKNFMCVLFVKKLYILIFYIELLLSIWKKSFVKNCNFFIILFFILSILFLMISIFFFFSGKLLSINKIIFSNEEFDLMKFFKEFFIVSL